MLGIVIVFIGGCSDVLESEKVATHPLFSDDKSKYSLLVVDDTGKYETFAWHEWTDENKIRSIGTIHGRKSLTDINNQYKFLELEKTPAFVVFTTKEIVLTTYSEEELIAFLKSNKP
ncbi:hypothetical protein [Pseudalkalibacillus berkeleyi]|uniref:Uncharacterized protein n=1 Tax=Pseudalkalibacillus berkeleyi TaxID=1069813 RepID=A0ABS9GYH1_9BACL|nr:hypothetical protein [Pseudalkalibacillus berkeleyi]MCF6137817.1 hypothetical protein [Pseudalkalibacillus berkeleyi]